MNEQPTIRRPGDPTADAAGTVVGGRYVIERVIARGGMATVYLAQDSVLNRPVALKVLSGSADPGERDAFLREARAVAQLSHPNIVGVYDAGVEGDLRYIVMQYIPGETLRDVIAREAPLEPRRAVELAIRLAEALDVGHRRGVVHCDVKPGNVLLGDHGEPRIVDFGIARSLAHTADVTQTIAGTVGYVSPEQVEGRPLDGRADVYSLAAVLYEMLTGEPPYRGQNLAAVAAQRLVRPPVPPRELNPAVPAELEAVVMRGLARDPEQRYPSAHAFAEALRAWLSGALDARTRRSARPVEQPTERITVARRRPVAGPVPVTGVPVERRQGAPWLFIMLAGTLAAVLVALLILLGANLFDLGGGGGSVAVPNLVGQRIDDAAPQVRAAGLRVGDVRFDFDARPVGTIIAQQPAPPAQLERGRAINIVVSSGPAEQP